MESEILMYVVAKAAEPTGTTITLASAQGDVGSVRFASDEHLSEIYQVGDGTIVTVQPLMNRIDSPGTGVTSGRQPQSRLPAKPHD